MCKEIHTLLLIETFFCVCPVLVSIFPLMFDMAIEFLWGLVWTLPSMRYYITFKDLWPIIMLLLFLWHFKVKSFINDACKIQFHKLTVQCSMHVAMITYIFLKWNSVCYPHWLMLAFEERGFPANKNIKLLCFRVSFGYLRSF